MSPRKGKLTVVSSEKEYHDAIKKDIKEFGYSLCHCYNIITSTTENKYISTSFSDIICIFAAEINNSLKMAIS